MGGHTLASHRQQRVLALVAGLSAGAQLAGENGWGVVLALPLVLVLVGLWTRRCSGDRPLGDLLSRGVGRLWAALLLGWGVFALGVLLRLSGERLAQLAGGGSWLPRAALLLLPLVWMAFAPAAAFARGAEIFFFIMVGALALVFLFGVPGIRWERLLPTGEGLVSGALALAGGACWLPWCAALTGGGEPPAGERGRRLMWSAALVGVLGAMALLTRGSLGPALTGEMERPFFVMTRGLGLEGALERMEAPVAALWVFADLVLAGVLLLGGRQLLTGALALPSRWGGWGCAALALAALGAAAALPQGWAPGAWSTWVPWGNLLLAALTPIAARPGGK